MTDRILPPELKDLLRRLRPKAAFISDIHPTGVNDCQHCGGAGQVCVFVATGGPFQAPGAVYNQDNGVSIVSHYDTDITPNGGWWIGRNYTLKCRECEGGLKREQKSYVTKPTQEAMGGMFQKSER